jgi:hypothetical protein
MKTFPYSNFLNIYLKKKCPLQNLLIRLLVHSHTNLLNLTETECIPNGTVSPILCNVALSSPCSGDAWRHRSSSHHRSTFHFPFVLSCLPTHLVSIPSLHVVYLTLCKCMCTFYLVRDGFCSHLFVVLVSCGFMNKTALLITQFCSPAPDFPATRYTLPYTTSVYTMHYDISACLWDPGPLHSWQGRVHQPRVML